MRCESFRVYFVAAFLLSSCYLAFPFALAEQATDTTASEPSKSNDLGGPDRYLTHLSVDKPIYRGGDAMFARAVVLHHRTRKPIGGSVFAMLEITGPKGESVTKLGGSTVDGVAGFRWQVPVDLAGGQYKATISPATGDAPAERKFEIRAYRPARLRSQISFLRKGYGSGERVTAYLKTERSEGGFPVDANVKIVARVDDVEVYRATSTVDATGNCLADFQLPDAIERGEGTLAMIIEDGGVVETASKTIPILLQHVDLNLYPEGGNLVADLENRVYLEAFTPANKPADIAGIIVDHHGKAVGSFATEHEGRGRFSFSPRKGRAYFLQIRKPTGIKAEYPLPKVVEHGATIAPATDTFKSDKQIKISVTASATANYIVTVSHRGAEIESIDTRLTANTPKQLRFAASNIEGVLAVTVRTRTGVALAERLVFREPSRVINIAVTPDAPQYVPGGKAKLTLTATDQNGSPVEGIVGVTVTDDSVLELIETRDQAPQLPAMVYLENEVRDLADAHIYLDRSNENSSRAVDLLLGTQGWRRFITMDVKAAIAKHGDDLKRALAYRERKLSFDGRSRWMLWHHFGDEGLTKEERREIDLQVGTTVELPAAVEPAGQVDQSGPDAVPKRPESDVVMELDEKADSDESGEAPERLFQRPNADQAGDRHSRRQRFRFDDESAFFEQFSQVQIREFAHEVNPNRQPNQRTDFTETLYWSAATKTDSNGKATIEFDLNDAVTSFKVLADAFTADGAIGSAATVIESVEPFYVEPKLPTEVTSGDFLQIPLSLINSTATEMEGGLLSVKSDSWKSVQNSASPFSLGANQRGRKILGVRVGGFHGDANLTLNAVSGAYSDQVTRRLRVKPKGFPLQNAFSGMLRSNQSVQHAFSIPHNVVPGSVTTKVSVHPSPLASMTEALAGLVREPHGCFEQTSSSNFPMVMAQQYFQSHVGVDPELVKRNAELLNKGYQKLIGFECANHGFEWFGSDPGHDALTAYGLLEFAEMAKVQHVDQNMINRTATWLLGQRDGKGGYVRKTQTLHTWVADQECANSYNTWALLEANVDADLSTEIDWVRTAAKSTMNSYVLALAANVMASAGDHTAAKHLCNRLADLTEEDGSVCGATTSVVGSGGEALAIETTALAISAWLQFPEFTSEVESSIKYLSEHCKAGRFGSTQSTILALRAIIRYDELRSRPKAAGSIRLLVDGKQVGRPIAFDDEAHDSLALPDIAGLLTQGSHRIQIEMADGSDMPYSASIEYHSVTPASSEDCKLNLEVTLTNSAIEEGDITEGRIVVTNRTQETLPTPIAIIGIPGGLDVRHEQLKELKSEGHIAAYEVNGREITLYWRAFEPDDRVDFPISLIAAIPGEYSAPSSRVYQYYTDEHKHWVAGPNITISPQ